MNFATIQNQSIGADFRRWMAAVVADGGSVDYAVPNRYNSLHRLAKRGVVLLPGAHKAGTVYALDRESDGAIMPFPFTRASAATYLDRDGTIKTAPPGVPRVEYDQAGNLLGLLIERGSTNLIPNSLNCYSNSQGWGLSFGAFTQNYATMLGRQATRCQTTATTAGSSVVGVFDVPLTGNTAGRTFTASCWMQSTTGAAQTIRVQAYGLGGSAPAQTSWKDYVLGPVPTRVTFGITLADADRTTAKFAFGVVQANGLTYDVLANMFQVEELAAATSWIETTGAAATRPAETLLSPVNLFGSHPITFFSDFKFVNTGNTELIMGATTLTKNNFRVDGANNYGFRLENNNIVPAGSTAKSGSFVRMCSSVDSPVAVLGINGVTQQASITYTPDASKFQVYVAGGARSVSLHIRALSIAHGALTEAQVTQLTQ